MIVEASKLKQAIEQAIREINDACYQMHLEGITCLLPEFVEFDVEMVTGNDINAVVRTSTESEANGSSITLREQLGSDVERNEKSGDNMTSSRTNSSGSDVMTMNHPTVTTAQSGGDRAAERVTYEYEK